MPRGRPCGGNGQIQCRRSEFRDRDLYPFCSGPDGIITVSLTENGKQPRELKDVDGKAFGEEIFKAGKEGEIAKVTYK